MYSLEKNKKKKKNYIFLLKRNIISIRATGVNLVIKRNSNTKFGKDEALDHTWPLCFCQRNEDDWV